ncbi:flagellar filament capping protein FliD [Achromobacter arsenitoxydans]|uniref:Flagellar hook-associated protein 2 n=1 Tax=Achromobacter arsenitoxydans SY8 TaxID=477184 RepID=H0FE36_9BURK|nr:flagellar filament capping protein FliD [Achromobacter arsenitoxydans]EHK63410.1 flagellar hook-associated protein 2 [Achromobacter arsenitoxydans SY8]
MATITNLGSNSGLPLEDILTKLQAAEEKKLEQYTVRQTSFETRVTAYGQLKSAVEAVQKAAAVLGKAETLGAVKGSVTGGDALTATVAAEGAVAGQYTINVKSIATSQTLQSGAVADRKASNGATGSFEIELADGTKKTVDLKDDTSLNGIVKAVNADDTLGVRATVITDGDGKSYLMLTAKDTGVEASVKSITVTGDQSLKDVLNYNTDAADTSTKMTATAAVDAEIDINGITVKSGTNNISTAIDGVTLNLTAKTEADKPITLKLESDPSVASKAIQSFVTAYNTLQTTIKNLTAFDATAATNQPLTGDGTTRSIQSSLASALQFVTGEGSMRSLADLGITTNPNTRQLTLDQTKLDKALASNSADVARMLSGADGLAANFEKATKDILSDTGSIKTKTDGLAKSIENVKNQYTRAKAAGEAQLELMRAQFVQLDKFVAQQSVTANYLTQQFAAMNKSNS